MQARYALSSVSRRVLRPAAANRTGLALLPFGRAAISPCNHERNGDATQRHASQLSSQLSSQRRDLIHSRLPLRDAIYYSTLSSNSTNHKASTSFPSHASSSSSSSSSSTSTSTSSSSSSSQGKGSAHKPGRRSMRQEIKEHAKLTAEGRASQHDTALLPPDGALVFPRIKTTSLSTKRVVIADEATLAAATLVLVAFRNVADEQLAPWRRHFEERFARTGCRWFDVTVNESFAAQAFSGFVQRWQRGYTDPALHDYFVAFNSKVRQPLEVLLLNHNRMFGNVLLLDHRARVRFRAAGPPTPAGLDALNSCVHALVNEHQRDAAQDKNL